MMLHKFRRAMVNQEREPLRGEVELDVTWIGGTQAGLRGSRLLKGRKAAIIVVAIERRGRASGRVRMAVIPDFKSITLNAFVQQNMAPGSTIYTDGLRSFVSFGRGGSDWKDQTGVQLRRCALTRCPILRDVLYLYEYRLANSNEQTLQRCPLRQGARGRLRIPSLRIVTSIPCSTEQTGLAKGTAFAFQNAGPRMS